jgi:hypothetical protein
MKYKDFEDLQFVTHFIWTWIQATLDFENGYWVSVISWPFFYTFKWEYELAIFKDWKICYDTKITDDVIGHLKKDEVSEIMKQIQLLTKKTSTLWALFKYFPPIFVFFCLMAMMTNFSFTFLHVVWVTAYSMFISYAITINKN